MERAQLFLKLREKQIKEVYGLSRYKTEGGKNKIVAAVANKNASIICALLAKNKSHRDAT